MKKITYNFLTGLKELSKKYNFDGFIDVELSPSSFKPHSYYTEFYIHTDAEDFTALMICKLLDEMRELLTRIKYPVNLEYAFSILSKEGTIYNLFDDSYEPTKESRQSNKIEFPCDYKKEEQCYTLSLDRGKITLKKDHDDKEEYFKENSEIIDFLNSFIDNKIPKTTPPAVKEVIKDIRKIRENIKDYIEINEPGIFLVNSLFFPELKRYSDNSEMHVISNKLSLEIKPAPSAAALSSLPFSPLSV